MRRCTRCTTPESYPGVTFDEDGVYSLCSDATTRVRTGGLGLDALGERVRSLGRGGPYDSGWQSEEGRANVANACDALGVRLVVVRPNPHI